MIGNSLKSDILPVLELRAFGFHIPYHTTWQYEMVDVSVDDTGFSLTTPGSAV